MRLLVIFDLPTLTMKNRKDYRNFRKLLIKNGFLMLQESVYCKLVLNASIKASVLALLETNKPTEGLVQIFSLTEKQFSDTITLVGDFKSETLNTDERFVKL